MLEIYSKDTTKSMYDYAKDYYEIREAFELEEKREMTLEESVLLLCILSNEEV